MADDDGFGQQDPSDSVGEYNPHAFVIWRQLALISTTKVVLVKAVDTGAKTVDVQIMVNQLDGNSRSTPHGTILDIPYMIWQFGKNAILADPVVGDIGVMVCADRDISAVKATKAVANPGSDRQLDFSDGIYLGGILNGDPEQFIKFKPDGGLNFTDSFGNVQDTTNAGISINGVVFNRSGQVEGNLSVTGAFNLGGTFNALDGSKYTGVIYAGDFIARFGATQVSMLSHIHANNNQPPVPGH